MPQKTKVIITAAVTGAIHTPSMSPHLPRSPDEIADAAIGAAEAGAAILHLHARDPQDYRPSQAPQHFEPILEKVGANTDAVINITTGGSPHMSVEERMRPVVAFKPELASLNMGSMNFGFFPMLDRFDEFEFEWEREHLEKSRDLVFKNTYADIERIAEIGRADGTRFEFECYDTSHLYNLAYLRSTGLIEDPLFVQTVMGLFGGTGAHPEDLMHMRRTAERVLPGHEWSVLGAGRHQMSLGAIGLAASSHVRVGLEDSLWIGPGQLATSNAQQVEAMHSIVESLGLEIASAEEARTILGLKGRDRVGF